MSPQSTEAAYFVEQLKLVRSSLNSLMFVVDSIVSQAEQRHTQPVREYAPTVEIKSDIPKARPVVYPEPAPLELRKPVEVKPAPEKPKKRGRPEGSGRQKSEMWNYDINQLAELLLNWIVTRTDGKFTRAHVASQGPSVFREKNTLVNTLDLLVENKILSKPKVSLNGRKVLYEVENGKNEPEDTSLSVPQEAFEKAIQKAAQPIPKEAPPLPEGYIKGGKAVPPEVKPPTKKDTWNHGKRRAFSKDEGAQVLFCQSYGLSALDTSKALALPIAFVEKIYTRQHAYCYTVEAWSPIPIEEVVDNYNKLVPFRDRITLPAEQS